MIKDKKLQEYFARDLHWGWARQYQSKIVFRLLVDASKFCGEGVILDAGAGHQRYRPFFENCHYISQEHDAGVQFKNMEGIKYDLISPIDVEIPLKNDSIEGVLSTSVIEHLKYPDRFLKEAYRVLKPGGRIFINVPFVNFLHEEPYDYNRPTKFALRYWLEEAGFYKIRISPTSSSTETICSYLPLSVSFDILKSNKSMRQYLQKIRKMKGALKKLGGYSKFIYAILMYYLTRILCAIIKLLIDRGPYEEVGLSVGWVATATKKGRLNRKPTFKTKEQFLGKNMEYQKYNRQKSRINNPI